jgi:alkylated DNA repair protein (DNA oxidative demethylase)
MTRLDLRGVAIFKTYVSAQEQSDVVNAVRAVLRVAPLFAPQTPSGRPMSVKMSGAGRFGWYSDRKGYRYVSRHPGGAAWPGIPACILRIWDDVTGLKRPPDCCLINWYGEGSRMGLHQDRDEADFSWPVVSVSLGDDGLFRIGNRTRGGSTESIWLNSGDVLVMGGNARLIYHGVDRIRFGSSRLLPKGGRLNLTLRVVE